MFLAAFGDPHFRTFDGIVYTFNGAGEFWLMRTDDVQKHDQMVQYELQGWLETVMSTYTGRNLGVFVMNAVKRNIVNSTKIFIICGTRNCQNANFRCTQWRQMSKCHLRFNVWFQIYRVLSRSALMSSILAIYLQSTPHTSPARPRYGHICCACLVLTRYFFTPVWRLRQAHGEPVFNVS